MSRRLIACRYPSAEVAVSSWERLSDHFASERAAGIATMRCIGNSDFGETHMVVAAVCCTGAFTCACGAGVVGVETCFVGALACFLRLGVRTAAAGAL